MHTRSTVYPTPPAPLAELVAEDLPASREHSPLAAADAALGDVADPLADTPREFPAVKLEPVSPDAAVLLLADGASANATAEDHSADTPDGVTATTDADHQMPGDQALTPLPGDRRASVGGMPDDAHGAPPAREGLLEAPAADCRTATLDTAAPAPPADTEPYAPTPKLPSARTAGHGNAADSNAARAASADAHFRALVGDGRLAAPVKADGARAGVGSPTAATLDLLDESLRALAALPSDAALPNGERGRPQSLPSTLSSFLGDSPGPTPRSPHQGASPPDVPSDASTAAADDPSNPASSREPTPYAFTFGQLARRRGKQAFNPHLHGLATIEEVTSPGPAPPPPARDGPPHLAPTTARRPVANLADELEEANRAHPAASRGTEVPQPPYTPRPDAGFVKIHRASLRCLLALVDRWQVRAWDGHTGPKLFVQAGDHGALDIRDKSRVSITRAVLNAICAFLGREGPSIAPPTPPTVDDNGNKVVIKDRGPPYTFFLFDISQEEEDRLRYQQLIVTPEITVLAPDHVT
ncbi:hypothetical protein EIP86_004418, partial [Pleurotus ostreatoroseus]